MMVTGRELSFSGVPKGLGDGDGAGDGDGVGEGAGDWEGEVGVDVGLGTWLSVWDAVGVGNRCQTTTPVNTIVINNKTSATIFLLAIAPHLSPTKLWMDYPSPKYKAFHKQKQQLRGMLLSKL